MKPFEALLQSRKFWVAVMGVVGALVAAYIPNMPPQVWQSITALAAVLIGSIAHEDAGRGPSAGASS